jgi:tRNA threonylcarbamoyladenosine dehydratase
MKLFVVGIAGLPLALSLLLSKQKALPRKTNGYQQRNEKFSCITTRLLVGHETKTELDDTAIVERNLRFAGVGRLYSNGDESLTMGSEPRVHFVMECLWLATVVVVGLGGVGSWSAEALCRSGVGNIVLIDLDDICISNTNRQIHTLYNTVGQMKVDEMKRRMLAINPHCNVTVIHDFVGPDNVDELFDRKLLGHNITALLDAIDGSPEKSALLAACVSRQIPVVTVGGAAGRVDPTQIVSADLTVAMGDKLLGILRKTLRKSYGFAPGLSFREMQRGGRVKKWNIAAVYSLEEQKELPISSTDASSLRRCDSALGTACFVTGTFGFVAAARIVDMIAKDKFLRPRTG